MNPFTPSTRIAIDTSCLVCQHLNYQSQDLNWKCPSVFKCKRQHWDIGCDTSSDESSIVEILIDNRDCKDFALTPVVREHLKCRGLIK